MKKNLLTTSLLLSFIISYSQASLIKDIMVGSTNGININTELFKYNNKILFKSFGGEVAVSDGTNSGTYPINIGIGSAGPEEFTLNTITNEVFFSAKGPAPTDSSVRELWKTNGLASGTSLVHDFTPSTGWSSNPIDLCENNGVIYCNTSLIGTGNELGFSDGTPTGSGWYDLNAGSSGSHPTNLFTFNGKVYFSAIDAFARRELWVTDGTLSGTILLKDINIASNSDPDDFVIFNNKLYFTATNGTNGRELWATNGTTSGTYMVSDINSGANSSDPGNFKVFGSKLFFSATSDSNGTELYYMLTNESVILYKDINPGPASSNPSNFTPYNGHIYFNADNGTNGEELWQSDGSIFGIGIFKDINSAGSSRPGSFQKYNGNLYFSADDGTNGDELWITDGTSAGTMLIADINPGASSSEPRSLVDVDGELLFHADNGSIGRELWKYLDPSLSVDKSEFNNISMYPNPTNSRFKIESNEIIESINIYDVQGKNIKTFNTKMESYPINDLQSGIYFVNIKSNAGIITKKLIKE